MKPAAPQPQTQVFAELAAVVGSGQLFTGEAIDARYHSDLLGHLHARPACVVRPCSTEEVAAVLRIANAHGVAVTTQGGRTGTVGGAIPEAEGIVLSLERMNAIEDLDPISMAVTVGAGAILQTIQEAAQTAGLFLPLDIGARGSAMIGGVISTNAGGLRTIRWGMAREMVLGIEAVLADGTVVSGLKKTIKDNAGYDWKHLLIGSEGTLGVITRATLRLRPTPSSTMTALLGTQSFEHVFTLLRELDRDLGGQLTSFEVMWRDFYTMVTEANRSKRPPPMSPDHAVYVLVEAMGGNPQEDAALFEKVLARAFEQEIAADVVIAQSERQRAELWAVREDLAETMMAHGLRFAFDVSVALRDMPPVAEEIVAGIRADYPSAVVMAYGHAGDGNLHFVVGVGDASKETEHKVDLAVYAPVSRAGGSISAEHGIGLAKRDYLSFTRSSGELKLMRTLKQALDPGNILNPGKVIALQEG